ncbi:MAG: HlyD family secretion protein [Acidobacteria bacterium]|nr:HlyD family secretion protein [Acidobacteriota bacterium]
MNDTTEVENEQRESPAAPPDVTAPRKASKGKLWRVLLFAAIVIAGVAVWFWLHYRNKVSTDDAQVDGHIAPISSRISGSVLQIYVDNNWRVKAGQILVQIDPRDHEAKVDQAKAALALAENQERAASAGVPLTRETTTTGTTGAEAQLAAAEAELNRARVAERQAATADVAFARANLASQQASAERARADLARMQPLMQKEEISKLQYDAYLAAARVADAQLQAAQEKLSAAEQQAQNAQAAVTAAQARVGQARAAVAQSRANQKQVVVTSAQAASAGSAVQQARANLEAAELQLSYTKILAPVDGVVTRKTVEPGQMLQPGQALMTIIPLHDVWVTANFKETQLAHVLPGQRAEVKVDMYGTTVVGRVDSIAGATGARLSLLPPENATGNFVKVVQRIPVKIVFDTLPPGVVLRPGMNVEATIITK